MTSSLASRGAKIVASTPQNVVGVRVERVRRLCVESEKRNSVGLVAFDPSGTRSANSPLESRNSPSQDVGVEEESETSTRMRPGWKGARPSALEKIGAKVVSLEVEPTLSD